MGTTVVNVISGRCQGPGAARVIVSCIFSFALALLSEFTVGLSLAVKGRGE